MALGAEPAGLPFLTSTPSLHHRGPTNETLEAQLWGCRDIHSYLLSPRFLETSAWLTKSPAEVRKPSERGWAGCAFLLKWLQSDGLALFQH